MSPAVVGPEELEAKVGRHLGYSGWINRLRFPSPVPVGSGVRLGATLISLEAFEGGRQATLNCVFEVAGSCKPSCVADVVFRYYD